MASWSHSRINCHQKCPAWHDLKYNQGAQEEPVPGFEFGSRMHELIHRYTLWCYNRGVSRSHEKAALMAAAEEEDRMADVLEMMADRLTFRRDLVYSGGKSIEQWFDVLLPNGDRFVGRIDLVEWDEVTKRWAFMDYKSGWPGKQSERPPRQQCLYAAAWREVVGESDAKFRFRELYPETGMEPLEWYPKEDDLQWDWLLAVIDDIKAATEFAARPSSACAFCPFLLNSCPCKDELLGYNSGILGNAERVVKRMVYAEAVAKRTKAYLKEYTKKNGPVGGFGWSYDPLVDEGDDGEKTTLAFPNRAQNRQIDLDMGKLAGAGDVMVQALELGYLKWDGQKLSEEAMIAKRDWADTPVEDRMQPMNRDLIHAIAPLLEKRKAKARFGQIRKEEG